MKNKLKGNIANLVKIRSAQISNDKFNYLLALGKPSSVVC
jgi:hypothetical protein